MRVVNELGTFSWLLLREEDPYGNFVEIRLPQRRLPIAFGPPLRAGSAHPRARRVGRQSPHGTGLALSRHNAPRGSGRASQRARREHPSHRPHPEDRRLHRGQHPVELPARLHDEHRHREVATSDIQPRSAPRDHHVQLLVGSSARCAFRGDGRAPRRCGRPLLHGGDRTGTAGRSTTSARRSRARCRPPGTAPASKFVDIDGDGTTDAIYHAAGIGTTSTHILWEESRLQGRSATGLGDWTFPALGGSSASSMEGTTGLPYFPLNGSFLRDDFTDGALRDLVDVDGDGDLDGISLSFGLAPWRGAHFAGWLPPSHAPAPHPWDEMPDQNPHELGASRGCDPLRCQRALADRR